QSLCTLRVHCRQWPRNTRYQAGATPYLGRTCTGWIAPACGWRTHSITSSARARKGSGIVRPIAFAALTLTINSNLVGCTTGRSPGLSPGIAPDLMIRLGQAGPVAHQAAGGSKFAHLMDRGDGVMVGERDQLLAPRVEEGIAAHKQPRGPQFVQRREGGVNVPLVACIQYSDLLANGARRIGNISQLSLEIRIAWI